MRRNPGRLPPIAAGKRVVVRLRNGDVWGRDAVTTVTPAGWAADGKSGCRWSLTGSPHDIVAFEVCG